MPDEIRLPNGLRELLDELKRLEKKKQAAAELGGAGVAKAINGLIAELNEAVAAALGAEAKQEAADAGARAAKLADGRPIVAAGEDQERVADAENEMQRIRDKLDKAKDLLGGNFPPDVRDNVRRIERALPELVEDLGRAAVAAAERELKELKEDIDDLQAGRPRDGNGPGDRGKQGDKDKDDDSNSGGGTPSAGAPSGSGGGANVDSIGDGGTRTEPKPLTIYVRSDRSVWAWARRSQVWVEQPFQSDIQEVKIIAGGLLVTATNEAALFDTAFGAWLGVLNVSPSQLIEGDASKPAGS